MKDWEYNPDCRCKQCTGEGLGWVKHVTKAATLYRRKKAERAYGQSDDEFLTDLMVREIIGPRSH